MNYFHLPKAPIMQLILADDSYRSRLLPFVFTRPCADIRCGILTNRERWEHLLGLQRSSSGTITSAYLSKLFPIKGGAEVLVVNGRLLPDATLLDCIRNLKSGQQLVYQQHLLAAQVHADMLMDVECIQPFPLLDTVRYEGTPMFIDHVWDIFSRNDAITRFDFTLLTSGRASAPLSPTNKCIGAEQIFLEEGARVECSIINASTGPVYIGRGAEIMEGCMVRGPFAMGEQSVLKMGAKVYGATTIGPGSKAGGEISNSVIFGNSNKAHDGFLGNSVIGEWCNLGADTNNSNLKNNYSEVKVWSIAEGKYIGTGLQFCGLFMGDHSKCSINTMFNTGTVVGVFANIFGSGFPEKYVPSFSWGSGDGETVFLLDKALDLAARVMARRNLVISPEEMDMLSHLYLQQLHPKADD